MNAAPQRATFTGADKSVSAGREYLLPLREHGCNAVTKENKHRMQQCICYIKNLKTGPNSWRRKTLRCTNTRSFGALVDEEWKDHELSRIKRLSRE